MRNSTRLMFGLALMLTAPLHAKTVCAPLPEGTPCHHFHYHVSVWNIDSRTYEEIAATRAFLSIAACDKARTEAMKENSALAEFVKTTKIETSFVANQFGVCHCDRTQEKGSAAFLDSKARLSQLRAQQNAAWSLRERLLGRDIPGVDNHLNTLFGRPPRLDRFLRETVPPAPPAGEARRTAPLMDSLVGTQGSTPTIAANVSLVPVSLSPSQATPSAQTEPSSTNPPTAQPPK